MGLTKLVDFKVFLPLIFAVLALGLSSSLQEAYAGNGFCDDKGLGSGFTLED